MPLVVVSHHGNAREHSLKALQRKARRGDARAQYALSKLEFEHGNRSEALRWLNQAVLQGYADACYTMANFLMAGLTVPYDATAARSNLATAAARGHADAQLLLSQLARSGCGGDKDTRLADHLLVDLGKRDHPAALCGLAMSLHIRNAMADSVEVLLERAAATGSHVAAYVQAEKNRVAALAGDVSAGNKRIKHLFLSANAGNKLATAELLEYEKEAVKEVLDGVSLSDTADPALNFLDIEEALATPVEYSCAQPEIVSRKHNIRIYRGLLTQLECAYIKAAAAPLIQASSTIHPITGRLIRNGIRTSSSMNFDPLTRDCFIYAIDERIAAASGTDVDQGEPLNVLYYRVGEEYKFHYDHLPEGGKEEMTFLRESGQRKYTTILSLNQEYSGGETFFPDLDVKYHGRTGDALMFQNVHDDGAVNRLTRHAGLPVSKGCKWVASKWIRERKFRFGTPAHRH